MYNYSDTGSGPISVIFFVLVVLIGAFFAMNLVLAIIVDQFAQAKDKAADFEDEYLYTTKRQVEDDDNSVEED